VAADGFFNYRYLERFPPRQPEGSGYTGEQWDHYIKMTFLRARYYQPETGRFASRDPWAGKLRWPESLNRYVYVANNPTIMVDPSGFDASLGICFDPNRDHRNLTDWLIRTLNANAVSSAILPIRMAHFPWSGHTEVLKTPAKAIAYKLWYDLVRDGGRWDFKDKIRSEIGKKLMLCDDQECGWYEFSVPGNIHYGYVGVAAGFTPLEMHLGASYANITDPETPSGIYAAEGHYFRLGKETLTTVIPLPEGVKMYFYLGWWRTLFDNPTDYAAIELGVELYKTYGRHVPVQGFKRLLGIYKSRLERVYPPTDHYYNLHYPYAVGHFDGGR